MCADLKEGESDSHLKGRLFPVTNLTVTLSIQCTIIMSECQINNFIMYNNVLKSINSCY